MPPYWWQSHGVRLSEHPPPPPPTRADHHYVPSPILLCRLSDAEAFGQKRGTPRLRPPGEQGMKGYKSQAFFFFFNAVIDEDEGDNWWCYWDPFQFETTWQLLTMLTVIIILMLIRPGNCGTCSVGQAIRTTLRHICKVDELGCVVPAFPLGP